MKDAFSEELIDDLDGMLARARTAVDEITGRIDELAEDMDAEVLREHLQIYERYAEAIMRASIFTGALYEVDQASEKRNQEYRRVQQESVQLHEEAMTFSLALKEFSPEALKEFSKQLPRYSGWLTDIARNAKYALSREQESIISRKDSSGIHTVEKLYGMITSRYTCTLEIDGEQQEFSKEELVPYLVGEDRDLRRRARAALLSPYSQDRQILAEIFSALVTDHDDEAGMRGYEHPIDTRHVANDIDADVYEALKSSADKHIGIFRRYLELKRRILGYEEMHAYDVRANVKGLPEGLSYEDAKDRVLEVFVGYADWMSENAQKMFTNSRIDVFPRENKRGGACNIGGLPNDLPLVILNHTQTYEALKTMAHELGHSVHSILAQHNSVLCIQSQVVLAESASNLAETLLFEDALSRADSQQEIALLCDYLDDAIGSIPVQLKYTAFEQYAHEAVQNGATPSDLSKKWADLSRTDFPQIVFEEEESDGWMIIPHLYELPFYCYGYSFGILVAMGLYEQATPEQVKEILMAGGSRMPRDLLLEYGMDIADEAFWDAGFAKIQSLVDRLERLL